MIYYIDGNNVQGESETYQRGTERGSRKLTTDIGTWAQQRGKRVVLFFDGGSHPRRMAHVEVRQPGRHSRKSADDLIVEALRSTNERGNVIVVTDDRELQRRAREAGAGAVKTAKEFRSEMQRVTQEKVRPVEMNDPGSNPHPTVAEDEMEALLQEFQGGDSDLKKAGIKRLRDKNSKRRK